jgi:hypothetical protein
MRSGLFGSCWRRAVDDLDKRRRPTDLDKEPAAGRHGGRLEPAEHRSLVGVAAHDQPRPPELPKALIDRLEGRPRSPGNPPSQDKMEPKLAAEAKQIQQRRQRTPGGGRQQVVVVNQKDNARPGPDRARSQPCRRVDPSGPVPRGREQPVRLPGRRPWSGLKVESGRGALGQLVVNVLGDLGDRRRGAGVADKVRQPGEVSSPRRGSTTSRATSSAA